jgi:hypothetical protein
MDKALEYVVRKFPGHAASMSDLYCTCEDFRILCEDYMTSVQTVESSRLKFLTDKLVENEYIQVSIELEKEIFQILQRRSK